MRVAAIAAFASAWCWLSSGYEPFAGRRTSDTKDTISILAISSTYRNHRYMDAAGQKRDLQVNVKMSADDFAILKQAADTLWPRAILSNSAIILGLAKIAAEDIIKPKKGRKSS